MELLKFRRKQRHAEQIFHAEKFDLDVEICGLLCYIKAKRKTAKNG